MKKISKLALLPIAILSLIGCQKSEAPIVDQHESTIIRNAKSTDEYLNKKDYKSIAYAYISKIKEEINSYESETKGNIKLKVAFFDYVINYSSITYKKGTAFYSHDHSSSTFINLDNEFYMASKDKILTNRGMNNYKVYELEEYKKISYTPAQYTIMGYVFNDESILKSQVISDKGDTIAIKYTLDNELATHIVKVDFKVNGGLSSYPSFKSIDLTLTMKRDFTPISYAIDSVYEAAKPFIGSSTVTQHGECLFSKINGDVIIPNEALLLEKLGKTPSEIIVDDDESKIKDDLSKAFNNLDFANGVNLTGNMTLNLFSDPLVMSINSDVSFNENKLTNDMIYSAFNFHAFLEGNEMFSSLLNLIKAIKKDALGEYEKLFDDFKSLEVTYDGDGYLYLISKNNSDKYSAAMKIRLTDLIDMVLRRINIYNLVTKANNDSFILKKVNEQDENNYKVELTLTEATLESFKKSINDLFENEDYAMIKTILSYNDFESVKITISVNEGMIKDVDALITYLRNSTEEEGKIESTTLLNLHMELNNQPFEYETPLNKSKELYEAYTSISDIKIKLDYLCGNPYVSKAYLAKLDEAKEEYLALNDMQKNFLIKDYANIIDGIKQSVSDILLFLETYEKYDLSDLDNEDIYELSKAYRLNSLNTQLLKAEIGEDNYNIISDLSSHIDYSSLTSALEKISGDDETSWGLSEQEIRDIKLIIDISEYETGVQTKIWFDLLMRGINMDFNTFKTKILNLYNSLS